MTPLRIEAVYERFPQGIDGDRVRWGFRASLDRDTEPDRAEQAPRAALPLVPVTRVAARSQRPVDPALPARRDDRDDVAPFPDLLGYGPSGRPIALATGTRAIAGRGQALDVVA